MALQFSSVTDTEMALWQAEIDALKPAKRPKWKGHLQNQSGAIQKVRYDPIGVSVGGVKTHFVHRLNAERKGKRCTELDWLPVLSLSDKRALTNNAPVDVISMVPRGARLVIAEGTRVDAVLYKGGAPIRGDDGAIRAQLENQVLENLTGNHRPRHHPVRVPARAGEPVRA